MFPKELFTVYLVEKNFAVHYFETTRFFTVKACRLTIEIVHINCEKIFRTSQLISLFSLFTTFHVLSAESKKITILLNSRVDIRTK